MLMKISAQSAFEFAKWFRERAEELDTALYDNWDQIAGSDRKRLHSMSATLRLVASDLVTHAVGIVIDESQVSLEDLRAVTGKARAALERINSAKQAISVAAALISLAAAVPTGSMPAIQGALKALREAV
jgi:hypothetical protein